MNNRTATSEDIPRIQDLFRQLDGHHRALLPDVFAETKTDARPDSLIAEWINGSDSDYLVVEDGDQIAGFLSIRETSNPDYPMFKSRVFAQIDSAVVDEDLRGKGIGSELLDAAKGWAKKRGFNHIQTTVWNCNNGAHRFYTEHGFKPVIQRLEVDIRSDG